MNTTSCLALIAFLAACPLLPADPAAPRYDANWKSLDAGPTPSWFTEAKFGIFIHWGVYSVPAWSVRGQYAEWYWQRITDTKDKRTPPWKEFHAKTYGPDFDYKQFAPQFRAELFDPAEWARRIAGSGAKYVVLTSKHHDGFCLWPSADANRTWGHPWNSMEVGPKRDLVGDLAGAVRKEGLKMGLYYSLYEWHNPLWLQDRKRYALEHMHPQFKDVVSRYAPSVIFSDGEWDMPSSDWRTEELMAWLFNESPGREEVVINDRWGRNERHLNGGYFTTEYGAGLPDATHPWEENRGMGRSYGYSRTEPLEDYRSTRDLVWMLADTVSRGGNLLLDIGPAADGTIPVIMQDRLAGMGAWLHVNGEAIFGTTPWKQTCQWTEGERPADDGKRDQSGYDIAKLAGMTPDGNKARKQAFFTTKPGALYAVLPTWPGQTFTVRGFGPDRPAKVSLLGVPGELAFRQTGDDLVVEIPQLTVDVLPCTEAWVLKVEKSKR